MKHRTALFIALLVVWVGAGCTTRITQALHTPESALHDPVADVYLISNINGSPFGEDGKGYIARIAPDGEILVEKWIDGETADTTLNAPKGMAIVGDVLWVADVNVVRRFDRESGAPRGEVAIEGASFLNDVAAGPDGTVYVADSGFGPGFTPTGSDAIYAIRGEEVQAVLKSADLGQPNGVLYVDDTLYFVTWATGELRRVTSDGGHELVAKLPAAQLDGLVRAGNSFLVSSWEGKAIYRVMPDRSVRTVAEELDGPADIGYDAERDRLLVPWFNLDRLDVRSN